MSKSTPYKYIAIEGNIGAGKTSLAKILATKFNSALVLEEFAENTFLPQFYDHPERFAFPLEMSFLAERFQQILSAQKKSLEKNQLLIGDYIFEKSLLFARVNLKGAEMNLFSKFYDLIAKDLQKPDLILYLHKETDLLLKNISLRGRSYEQSIPSNYLEQVSQQYLNHLQSIDNQRIIILKSDDLDFVNEHNDLIYILDLLKDEHPKKVLNICP
jgi:deoxyguanosine kinase